MQWINFLFLFGFLFSVYLFWTELNWLIDYSAHLTRVMYDIKKSILYEEAWEIQKNISFCRQLLEMFRTMIFFLFPFFFFVLFSDREINSMSLSVQLIVSFVLIVMYDIANEMRGGRGSFNDEELDCL